MEVRKKGGNKNFKILSNISCVKFLMKAQCFGVWLQYIQILLQQKTNNLTETKKNTSWHSKWNYIWIIIESLLMKLIWGCSSMQIWRGRGQDWGALGDWSGDWDSYLAGAELHPTTSGFSKSGPRQNIQGWISSRSVVVLASRGQGQGWKRGVRSIWRRRHFKDPVKDGSSEPRVANSKGSRNIMWFPMKGFDLSLSTSARAL